MLVYFTYTTYHNLLSSPSACRASGTSKGQSISKAFFLETPLPKNRTKYIFDKILPYEARAEFFQIFLSFLG